MHRNSKTCLQRCGRVFCSLAEATLHNLLSESSVSGKDIPLGRMSLLFGLALSERQVDKFSIIKREHLIHTSTSWLPGEIMFDLFNTFKKRGSRCSIIKLPHFLLLLFPCDLGFGNQHKNLIYNPCHLIIHKSPQCVCSPYNHGHSAFLWPQQCPWRTLSPTYSSK